MLDAFGFGGCLHAAILSPSKAFYASLRSSRPERQTLDVGAAGQFLELLHDGLAVLEEFVADDGVRTSGSIRG